jgi:hypothetical protein
MPLSSMISFAKLHQFVLEEVIDCILDMVSIEHFFIEVVQLHDN